MMGKPNLKKRKGLTKYNMFRLYREFCGYLQLYFPKIKWVILFGLIFLSLLYLENWKGAVQQKGPVIFVCKMLLSLTCSFIFVMTLFGRTTEGNYDWELMPFESYYNAWTEGSMEIMLQILVNIAMYIPLGFLLPCCFRWFERYRHVLFVASVSSLLIELIQLIFKIGLFEVDDIINNILGAIIGIGLYTLLRGEKS